MPTKTPALITACATALVTALALALLTVPSFAQERVVTPEVSIEQSKLLQQTPADGGYHLRKVLESGGQLFTIPYVDGDGYSEGPNGPRAVQRSVFYPYVERTNPEQVVYENGQPVPAKSGTYKLPYLRLNGIDSQSCFECHHSIGVYHEPGTVSAAMTRKPGVVGGAAGRANTLFQNPDWPTRLADFYRSPPHVFGTGYGQRLANEMTMELLVRKTVVDDKARAKPGTEVCSALKAKTSEFGTYCSSYYDGEIHENLSDVVGVASDLVVRPFQFKGIASSVRHFVETALDFHFSMQSVERTAADLDCDLDGKFNEMAVNVEKGQGGAEAVDMSLGNVAALSSFVAMTRPPHQVIEKSKAESIARGEKIFRGEGIKLSTASAGLCAQCHTPTLRIQVPVVTIAEAEAGDSCPEEATGTLGSASFDSAEELPIYRAMQAIQAELHVGFDASLATADAEASMMARLVELQKRSECDNPTLPAGYRIHLNEPGKCTGSKPQELPPYIYPRLKPNKNGTIDVPLYSDLKLHDMGEGLSDVMDQETDVAGVFIPKQEFLTRPLWGVSASNPWMHDGRSTTLLDAIFRHRSEGSEANPVIDEFEALSDQQKDDVVNFLLSLVLPVPEGSEATNECPPKGCTTVCPTDGCVYHAMVMH